MNPIYDALPPDVATELQPLSRLIYETRENRRQVLQAFDAQDEASLLTRITSGELAEHPAYEHYLAARILADTQEAARGVLNERLKEVNTR